ncbi:MAG TPA: permease prefix domain 1-containing protein [Phycisphaerales bacterium]|nr:permease prefix domain 1-containing protein [Phycisphaerales bacterium]
MSHALRLVERPSDSCAGADAGVSSSLTSAWLSALFAMLRLPEAERRQIRDELECHLEERVRDLMVTGMGEEQAAVRAIAELGDASTLARRFHAAHSAPRRRSIMNIAMAGLAVAALITGTTLLQHQGGRGEGSVYAPPQAQQPAGAPVKFELGGAPLEWNEFFQRMAELHQKKATIYWTPLAELDTLLVPGGNLPQYFTGGDTLESCIEMLNAELRLSRSNRLEYRFVDDRIVFASTAYFDANDVALATFDVADLVGKRLDPKLVTDEAVAAGAQEIASLITGLVEPELWRQNDGSRADIRTFGGKLFVKVPRRVLPQVEWLLSEARGAGPTRITAILPVAPTEAVEVMSTLLLVTPQLLIEAECVDQNVLQISPYLVEDVVELPAELLARPSTSAQLKIGS